MIFFDTNIWIELLAVRTPEKEHEIKQARLASNLLKDVLSSKCKIFTCKEQLIEIIIAVQKIKQKEYNQHTKENGSKGVGSLKEFRKTNEFAQAQALCATICNDIRKLATVATDFSGSYEIEEILRNLPILDINDYMYFNYCSSNKIKLYTFDKDFEALNSKESIIEYVN